MSMNYPAYPIAPFHSVPAVAPAHPVPTGSPHAQLFVSETHVGWTTKKAGSGSIAWSDVASIRLNARMAWGQAGLWYLLFAIIGLGMPPSSLPSLFVLITICAISNLVLRRHYVLSIVPKAKPPIGVFLGVGYPSNPPFTLMPSGWIATMKQGYAWIQSEARRRGIPAV